ncbi:MAG: hypothetical protein AB2421_04380 [Thermotaleaceae bacterium]
MMTEETAKNLDMDYIFNRIVVYTPYGEGKKKEMSLYQRGEEEALKEELDRTDKVLRLLENHRYIFVEIRNLFKTIKDLRGSFQRVKERETLSVIELFEIKIFLNTVGEIAEYIKKLPWDTPKALEPRPIESLQKLLDPQQSGVQTFFIYDEYSEDLRALREKIKTLEVRSQKARMEVRERVERELGVKLRPSGEVTIHKGNREMLEKVRAYGGLVYSAETYMNITYKLKMDEAFDLLFKEIEELKLAEEEEEFLVRQELTGEIGRYLKEIHENVHALGALDLMIAKAYFALGIGGVKPQVVQGNVLDIAEGRYIKVEDSLRKESKAFTPISLSLKEGVTCITGANMGGKTISLKLMGQLSVMAQYGLFVPAGEMTFSLKAYIFISLGDLQSTDMGLSTFGAEILEIRKILKRAEEAGLILMDELARGTNPSEGYALSKAVIDYLKEKEAMTVITTHIDGLTTDPLVAHLQVRGLADVDFIRLKEEFLNREEGKGIEAIQQYMDYRLEVVHNRSKVPRDAINIARLMGLEEAILQAAEKYLDE